MKKLILVVLAVFFMSSIASAATTVDIKGQIRVYPEWNNFGRGSGVLPNYLPGGALPAPAAPTKATSHGNFFTDQRTRLYFNAKSNENVGAAVALEIDSFWGQEAFGVNRGGTGAGLGTDSVNIEVKFANLWFKPLDNLKITAGTMTYVDDISGVFVGGGDMAGFRVDYALSKASSLATGVYTWWQTPFAGTTNPAWKDSVYFVPLTLKQQLGPGAATAFVYAVLDGSKPTSAGTPPNGFRPVQPGVASYESAQIFYAGLNYGGKAGIVSYYLMGAYNFGTIKNAVTPTVGPVAGSTDDEKISAFAVNAKVDVKLGAGKLRVAGLFVSGDDSTDRTKFRGFITGDQYAGHQTMPMLQDDLIILINNTDVCSNATFLALNANNNGDGVGVVYGAFDFDLTQKLNAKAVVGYATADKQNSSARLGKTMGTEYNAQLAYKFDENLMIKGVGSYATIGDYFKTAGTYDDPDAAYRVWLKFIYTF